MVEVQRVNGRLVRAQQKLTLQQRLAQQKEQRRIAEQLKKRQVQMVTAPSTETNISAIINKVNEDLKASIKLERQGVRKNDRPQVVAERTRQRQLKSILKRLEKGELIPYSSIESFVTEVSEAARAERAARVKAKPKVPKKVDKKVTPTTLKIGGKVIVGFKDAQGNFSPSGKGDNRKVFEQVQKAWGTRNVKEIERIKNIPEVKSELTKQKKQAKDIEVTITQFQTQLSRARARVRKKNEVVTNPELELFKQTLIPGGVPQVKELKTAPVTKQRFTKAQLQRLERLRLQAIAGNKNAQAALIGIAAIPFALTEFAIEVIVGIVSFFKDPAAAIAVISNLRKSDIEKAGANFGKRIQKGEPKALVDLVASVTPLKIPRTPKFISKLANEANQIQSATTNFKVIQDMIKGSGKIELNTQGINQGNQAFKSKITLALRPKDKSIFGTVKTTIDGKTSTRNINLKDEGAFYVDRKTKIKIPKSNQKLDSIQLRSELSKTRITSRKGIITATTAGTVREGEKITKKIRAIVTPKVKSEVTTKVFNRFEQFLGTREGKPYKDFREKNRLIKSIKAISRKNPKSRTKGDWNKLVKFLEFHDFDKTVINGFDKRTWMALMLNLNKKATNRFIKSFEDDIIKGYVVKKAKATATGSFETIKPTRFALGPSFALSKPSVITKFKRTKKGVTTPQDIKIPDIDSLISMPKKLGKGVKLPLGLFRIAIKYGVARQYDFDKLTKAAKAKELDKIKPIKVPEVKKIPLKLLKVKKVAKKVIKPVKKLKKIVKPVPKRIKKVKVIKPKKPIRVILPNFDSAKYKDRIVVFEGQFRERKNPRKPTSKRNPVITKSIRIRDTRNRALKKVAEKADNKAIRSIQIRVVGITDKKKADIVPPRVLRKFTKKKSKNTPVLRLVEKSKYALDKRNEKRELKTLKRKKKK